MGDDLPRLSVLQVGRTETPRFVIHDQFRRLWSGQRFEISRTKARLYRSRIEALAVAQDFVRQHYEHRPRTHFVVPVVVEVWSEESVSAIDVSDWCSKATCLTLNSSSHGNGPESSLILPTISWPNLHEVEL